MVTAFEIVLYFAMFAVAAWLIWKITTVVWGEWYIDENGKKRWHLRCLTRLRSVMASGSKILSAL